MAPEEDIINRAYQILSKRVEHVEYLIGYEGNAFAFTGNVETAYKDHRFYLRKLNRRKESAG